MQMEELSNHSINDPTLLKRKEHANDCMTTTWQEPDKNTETFLAINNNAVKKDTKLRATKNMTTRLTLKQVGGYTNSRGWNLQTNSSGSQAYLQTLGHRRQPWTEPIGRRAIGIPSIPQALTTGEFFSGLGPVSVAWRKTSSKPTGGLTSTLQRQHVQSCTTWSHFITRTRVAQAQGLHIFVHKFSHPFHPFLLPFRQSHLCTQAL